MIGECIGYSIRYGHTYGRLCGFNHRTMTMFPAQLVVVQSWENDSLKAYNFIVPFPCHCLKFGHNDTGRRSVVSCRACGSYILPTHLPLGSSLDTRRLIERLFNNKLTGRRFSSAGSRVWNTLEPAVEQVQLWTGSTLEQVQPWNRFNSVTGSTLEQVQLWNRFNSEQVQD